MTKLKLPLSVWLSEDGSGIIPKIEYDTNHDQLIGQVLPIDELTGMPIPHSFITPEAEDIAKYVTNPQLKMATIVYIIMAQPLKENIPPFLLCVFGTDNKFTSDHVLKRWQHVETELAKYATYLHDIFDYFWRQPISGDIFMCFDCSPPLIESVYLDST